MMEQKMPMQPWPALAQYAKSRRLKNGNLFYYDSDAGAARANNAQPALILIHGLGDESDSFRHIIPLLAQAGYRVIAPDLPGFGRSNGFCPGEKMTHNTKIPWKGRTGLGCHVQALISLMEETAAARPGQPVVLVGSSMGSVISQLTAHKRPDLVKAIILMDGCHPLSGRTDAGFLLMALPFIGKAWYRNFRKNHEGAWRSLYSYYRDLDAMSNDDKVFLRNRVIDRVESRSQEHAYFSSLRSMISLNLFRRGKFLRGMKNYTGKILLLWGEADKVMPFEASSDLRALRPDAAHQFIGGAGHLPQQEAPVETAAAIIKWLNNLR